MKIHLLKTDGEPFAALLAGTKTFEFRENDRDYHVADILCLTNNENEKGVLFFFVTHILHGPSYGMPKGYCCMSVRSLSRKELLNVLSKVNTVSTSEAGKARLHVAE